MNKNFRIDPKLDLVLERFIDAPIHLVWEALTKPEHVKEWYMRHVQHRHCSRRR
jgi:uncharacterized protein YndB with AHSA1/START domain